jgi:hypothetical protein
MDRLQLCMEELRRLARETEDPDCVVLAEQAINDYLQNEIDALRSALERIGTVNGNASHYNRCH